MPRPPDSGNERPWKALQVLKPGAQHAQELAMKRDESYKGKGGESPDGYLRDSPHEGSLRYF